MKSLRKGVDQFYRLRVVATFESGRVHEQVLGPFTTPAKLKEIETRMARIWNAGLRPKPWRTDPDSILRSVRYIGEVLPAYGWYPKFDNEYVPD